MAKKPYTLFFLALFFTILIRISTVLGAYQLEYRIGVGADGSATWIIEHVFVKGQDEAMFAQLSSPVYFSDTFVENVKLLADAAKEETGRMNMTVENFAMEVSVSGSYSIVKYQFHWKEFAQIEDTQIKIGDVFRVDGLFLYGEGTVNIEYPPEYAIESVSPRPNAESGQTLTWYGIRDFETGEPRIVLREKVASGFIEIVRENALTIISLTALVGAGSMSFYYLRLRKKGVAVAKPPIPPSVLGIEDDEEKVTSLLRAAAGRSMYQSNIADHCKFSRSKTSKLLKTMESKGKIRREKKGREMVVTLMEEV